MNNSLPKYLLKGKNWEIPRRFSTNIRNIRQRLNNRDHSICSGIRASFNIDDINLLIRKYRIQANEYIAFAMLTKLRVGDIFLGPRLAAMGKIPAEYDRKCPCCKSLIRETLLHFLCECIEFNITRSSYMQSMNFDKVRIYYILKDVYKNKNMNQGKIEKTLLFLKKMIIKRAQKIKEIMEDNN